MGQNQSHLLQRRESRQRVEALLREQTEDFARIWLVLCEQMYDPKTAIALPASNFRHHWLFSQRTGVEFYELTPAERKQDYPPKLARALKMWDTCFASTYVIFERVKQRLLRLPEVRNVEWLGIIPNPPLILMWKGAASQGEILPQHEIIRITTSNRSQYVLDVSGWQFGLDDFFFSWENYETNFIAPGAEIKVRVVADEYAEMESLHEQKLLTLAFVQHYKAWVTEASDSTLNEVGRRVSLAL